ncbi:MAG: hypothetical protein EPO46_02935 [Lysobacter sp.]|nr:MAG: hypothetical protein EPO46_02935 [Lysobacter sp.]
MNAWPGWSPRDSLILPLEDAPPATPVDIDGRRFEAKDQLHVTVVGGCSGRCVLQREDQAVTG